MIQKKLSKIIKINLILFQKKQFIFKKKFRNNIHSNFKNINNKNYNLFNI